MRLPLAALVLLLTSCATPQGAPISTSRQIAITIDDLPVHGPFPPGLTPNEVNEQMIAALREGGVGKVYTFVNGHSLETNPETAEALDDWRAFGAVLGNHGWAHKNLNDLNVADYEREIMENEPLLARLGGDSDWRWYRYPFLAEGDDAGKRKEVRDFLAAHHYRVAAVTMGFSDWAWTEPYARCSAKRDSAAILKLERLYLQAALANARVAPGNARKLYGRDIPYVLLMHVSAMSARMMPRLIQLYRKAGFHFVSLAEAESDPVYLSYTDLKQPSPDPTEQLAKAKGVQLMVDPDYSAQLNAMCR